jgi:two-component system chemotaxis response regulator CheB
MKQAGAATFAQDEASCVVYGMPRVAVEAGAVDRVLPLARIAEEVLQAVEQPAA